MPSFCENFIMILGKREFQNRAIRSKLIPFKLSKIQLDMQDKAGKRNITLKPRQIGSTTWHIICRLFLPAILTPGTSGLLISQTKGYGAQHFRILQRALKNFGRTPLNVGKMGNQAMKQAADEFAENLLHTQFSARHEIVFDFLDSKVLVETAENPDAGSGLTIQHLVATEVAYWAHDPETLLAQAKETVPNSGTVDEESTPNGMAGYFYEEWQRAKHPGAEFRQHFYPWWWQEEYGQETKKLGEDLYRVADHVVDFKEDKVTVEEEKMMKEFLWTLKQLAWRRSKQVSLRNKFPEKYPEDSQTCFLTSGEQFFDRDILIGVKARLQNESPIDTFHDGQLKIFKPRIKGRRYVIGADCAEGRLIATENPDWQAAMVLDMETGEQVALYHSRMPPEDYGEDLVDLAEMYNNALLAIERNGPGGSVILTVQRQRLYGGIYYHKDWHREKATVVKLPGYPTTPRTRPVALNEVAAMIRRAPEFIHSEDFVDEALNFVWRHSNKANLFGKRVPQGQQGAHDDIVMAMSVAALARLVELGYWDPIDSPSQRYGQIDAEEDSDAA